MKKIISLVSALAIASSMMLSAGAAELAYNADNYVVTSLPSIAELEARTPSVVVSAKQLTTTQEVKDAGIGSMAAAGYIKDIYDTYEVTATVSNLGDLAVGYTDEEYGTQQGVVLRYFDVTFQNSDKILKKGVGACSWSTTKSLGVDGSDLNLSSGVPAAADYCYPTFTNVDGNELGNKIENPTETVKCVICIAKGDSLNLTGTSAIGLSQIVGTTSNLAVIRPTVAPITLAAAPAGPSFDSTAKLSDTTNGYVWDVTMSDFTGDTATVKFTDSESNVETGTITGLNGIETDGDASFALILNLHTPRTITNMEIVFPD